MEPFQAGAGMAAGDLRLAIALIFALAALTWLAWSAVGHWQAWQERELTFFDLLMTVVRGAIVISVFGFFIR